MEIEHHYRVINGVRLHCAVAGSGPLLVLLHGFPETWYAWRYQIPVLAEHFTVVAPDMRGYNESEQPPQVADYGTAQLVTDVVELVHSFGAKDAVVVGHDWGGAVAWNTACWRPDVVNRLIVLNIPHPKLFIQNLLTNPRQMLRSWYIGFFQIPWIPEASFRASNYMFLDTMLTTGVVHPENFGEEVIEHYKEAGRRSNGFRGGVNYYRAVAREGAAPLVQPDPVVGMPTLMIWGEQDFALGKELNDNLARYVPDLTLRYIADASHWVQQERPDLVSQYMLEFLGKA